MGRKFRVDNIDLGILRELREDSKQSFRTLAQKMDVHPNTIVQRIRRLEQEKVIIKYSTDIDYRKIGYEFHALILVKMKKGRSGDVGQLESISKIPQVQALYAITGNYDVVMLLRVKDRDELSTVLRKIIENKDIVRTNTSIMLYTYKQPYDFNPLLK